ncbi:MAG: hypothetical protein AAFS10_08095, partial [Myxococcota bacterium]
GAVFCTDAPGWVAKGEAKPCIMLHALAWEIELRLGTSVARGELGHLGLFGGNQARLTGR